MQHDHANRGNRDASEANSPLPLSYRFAYVGAGWLLCLIAVSIATREPLAVVAAPFFPAGLVAFWTGNTSAPNSVVTMGGWLCYIMYTAMLLAIRDRGVFWSLCVVLLVVLAMNVKGCVTMTDSFRGMGR